MRSIAFVVGVAQLAACGAPARPTQPQGSVSGTATAAPARAPELYPPAWKTVGVGQTIALSTATIQGTVTPTRTTVTKMPASATFDAITQTIVWTPAAADMPKATFEIAIEQPGAAPIAKTWTIEVVKGAQPAPSAPQQSAVVEELLMIRDPARLAEVNQVWPFARLLAFGAETFKLQFPEARRAKLTGSLDEKTSYTQFLTALAQTHGNPRLDPASPKFDRDVFGDPASWKIVAFRPRIDKAWTELRVVYKATKSREPVYAMFRLRPVVEYVPALPRPEAERTANNKIFLGMVAKHLLEDGAPSERLMADPKAHGHEVAQLMTDVMTFDDTKTAPYLHGFEIGIALEARMGGGSVRDASGAYVSGDGWAWSAEKPFQTADGTGQLYQNVAIPGFWTKTVPSDDQSTWVPACAPRFTSTDPSHAPGYDVLCRKTMGYVDLPAMAGDKPVNGKIDANNLYADYKQSWMVEDHFPLDDGRRDLGEENGMTCAQCHIRTFGMHDYSDRANTDPRAGAPKSHNHALRTLNFVIIPTTTWEPFTLEFLQHQECRGKANFEQYLGADAASGLICPLAM